jgi:hypothetical protein
MPSVTFGLDTFNQEEHIIANDQGLRMRPALTVDADLVQLDADGNKVVRPGSILYKLASGKGRLNVRATLGAAVTASSTTSLNLGNQGVQYTSKMAQFFNAGDVIRVLRPYATITIAGAWAADNVLTLVLNGQTSAIVAGSTVVATIASKVATDINADPVLSKVVQAIAGGAVVYLFSQSLASFTVSATENADGTATVSTVTAGVTVGTIDTAGVNVTAGTVTLAAAAAVTLPAGAPVGLTGATPYSVVHYSANLAEGETDISGLMSALIYGDRLPYWDGAIAAELPEIKFF